MSLSLVGDVDFCFLPGEGTAHPLVTLDCLIEMQKKPSKGPSMWNFGAQECLGLWRKPMLFKDLVFLGVLP